MGIEVKCQDSSYHVLISSSVGHDVDKPVVFEWPHEDNGIII